MLTWWVVGCLRVPGRGWPLLGLQMVVQEKKPGHRQVCCYARCDSVGYLQEDTPPETKGEKPQPSKDEGQKEEEPKKKEHDDAGKEKPNEEVKKDQPKPGTSPF